MTAFTPGLIIAAPASGSGKTTVTLALLRALCRAGVAAGSFKIGPDYIDPAFHAAASGRACPNLDSWAMRPETIARLLGALQQGADLVLGEGVMGLFDGAVDGTGSTADVAALTGWPVLLVIDVRGQAASAAALLRGFAGHRADVRIAGVLFNRVGGPAHADILRRAVAPLGIPVLGCLPRIADLAVPERHLGLVQASERADLAAFLDRAADWIVRHVDLGALQALAAPMRLSFNGRTQTGEGAAVPPLGQRIAVADDAAFTFAYAALLEDWRAAGAELSLFSPLADEAPTADADAVYLPGGYPELHAGRLAGNDAFLAGLRQAAVRGATVFGECGGYMTLGAGLVDAEGRRHAMAGLLPLEASFADRRLHLGYRQARLAGACALGDPGQAFRGHEFHYASIVDEGDGKPLFECRDATGRALGSSGRRCGTVFGSFVHLIDRVSEAPAGEGR
ncbi:cobyrinate a,c-diamide synthase [Rhodospirillaceae bacterium SYSU D60014]|uniref:cobyrinate a,c-diamide synthase n=1 Tax=Virgifigura deserti TaxID=2268457 RepID=UPI000E66CF5A